MSIAVKEERKSKFIGSKDISQSISIFEDEAGMSELELAKSRRTGEFISGEDFITYMKRNLKT